MILHNGKTAKNPARVIVIGSSGFIGRQVIKDLRSTGVEVVSITSQNIDLTKSNSRQFLLNLLLPTDAIVMLSALTPGKGDTALQELARFSQNLAMADNLCWVLGQTNIKQLVYISSVAVYQESITHAINEATITNPASLYGMAHIVRERILAKIVPAKNLCILRPCAVYGVGDTHAAYGPNRFLQLVAQGKDIQLFGQGEELRHHIHVVDVAKVIIQALLCQSYGVLNLVSPSAISFIDLAKKVIAISKVKVNITPTPRNNHIIHQEFNNEALARAFPGLELLTLDAGLQITYAGD